MVDLNAENYRKNAELLLEGIWYSGLPDLLDINELMRGIDTVFSMINNGKVREFSQESDGFIVGWNHISSPPYIRSPGVEALTYFDFKKNNSLREMQIPNLLHYISFMYNTLTVFDPLFKKLYLLNEYSKYIENSNSYLVFADLFEIYNYDELVDLGIGGTFTTKNNKANSSAALSENKRRMLDAENAYLYSLKMDIESFFPSLYTHNFEKMGNRLPFSNLSCDLRYYTFLDAFHQRINNNQTKGIPAGVFSSHIAAELCMLCVDEEIRQHIKRGKHDVGFIRYVDDIVFFSDSESALKALFPTVQSILNNFRLRINGNKTEAIHSVLSIQPSYITELERLFPALDSNNETSQELTLPMFFEFRKYIGDCLSTGRSSQVRTMLSIMFKRISDNQLKTPDIDDQLFFFFLRLVFEDHTLVSHVFRLLDLLLSNSEGKSKMLCALEKKRSIIDTEYPDTTLQIWYYYILFRHSGDTSRSSLINSLQGKKYNPLVIASMVLPGKKNNLKLFSYIRDTYVTESGSQQWKNEIQNGGCLSSRSLDMILIITVTL